LRSEIAENEKSDARAREGLLDGLDRRAHAILADASLKPMHEPTLALMRSARARLTPEARLEELSRYLDDPAADPYSEDRLGDWASIAGGGRDRPDPGRHDFVDWILTLRACGADAPADRSCAVQAAHALERWQRTSSPTWMAAALILGTRLPPSLEKSALAVAPNDPAYLTVRYHLARLYRLAGKRDQARAISDAVLALALSPGTRNLFREERFAVATSVADATQYLMRVNVDVPGLGPQVNDDGLGWFNHSLAVKDMLEAARQSSLPPAVRARMTAAVWIRAELLGNSDLALAASDALDPLAPILHRDLEAYRAAKKADVRRHVMLVTALRYDLSPHLGMEAKQPALVAADDTLASNWCRFTPDDSALAPPSLPWRLPGPPATGDAAQAGADMRRLAPLKTATGLVGDQVLDWAAAHPADPEVPWLLHVVVMSTRGGCLDKDSPALSRKAYRLLHARYPASEWSEKTPYFY
jgi:hypothetical protein